VHARTVELARLSTRMVEQHEEERRRLSRELHDETAQVFSAVKIELGLLRDGAAPAVAKRLDRALDLMDTGIRSIRAVTNDLRPSLLDDLGLVPALRSLGSEFSERTRIATDLTISGEAPVLSKDAELALFRALQEALSNVARHAGASAVAIQLARESDAMVLSVQDNGRGVPPGTNPRDFERNGHMGLAGMRERIRALGGDIDLTSTPGGGVRLTVRVPLAAAVSA
jgi:signal transduction histidine kinase